MTLETRLKKRAQGWASLVTRKANEYLGDKKGLIAVRSTVESVSGGVIQIKTTALGIVARAYEYGSGIHSRRKSRKSKYQQPDGRILITPKKKKVLAFFWDKVDSETPSGQKFIGISASSGKALFRFVEHPGVKAVNGGRGYLAPAVNEVRKKVRSEVSEDVEDEVVAIFRKSLKKR